MAFPEIEAVFEVASREGITPNGFEDGVDPIPVWREGYDLRRMTGEVEVSRRWLSCCKLDPAVNDRETSYGLKTQVEQCLGYYIANGAFLVAAFMVPGVLIERVDPSNIDGMGSLNGFLNVSRRDRPLTWNAFRPRWLAIAKPPGVDAPGG